MSNKTVSVKQALQKLDKMYAKFAGEFPPSER